MTVPPGMKSLIVVLTVTPQFPVGTNGKFQTKRVPEPEVGAGVGIGRTERVPEGAVGLVALT